MFLILEIWITAGLTTVLEMLNHSPEIPKNQNLQVVNGKNECSTWPSVNDMSNSQSYLSLLFQYDWEQEKFRRMTEIRWVIRSEVG